MIRDGGRHGQCSDIQQVLDADAEIAGPARGEVGSIHGQPELTGDRGANGIRRLIDDAPRRLRGEAVNRVQAGRFVQRESVLLAGEGEPPVLHPIGEREEDRVPAPRGDGIFFPSRIAVEQIPERAIAPRHLPTQAVEPERRPNLGPRGALGVSEFVDGAGRITGACLAGSDLEAHGVLRVFLVGRVESS